jgi:hypothetical protein
VSVKGRFNAKKISTVGNFLICFFFSQVFNAKHTEFNIIIKYKNIVFNFKFDAMYSFTHSKSYNSYKKKQENHKKIVFFFLVIFLLTIINISWLIYLYEDIYSCYAGGCYSCGVSTSPCR